ncbi:hypothetical protein GTP23_09490 [Pseudoduganella sp. FT93W]|uniref:Uncharacterized protein n=1 Tax=Duganella fentianensis TaxID=2692177 RepID=A0A845I0G7_9BURK|nr:hypothetical protein [Duganella fentianensis]MYN45295.1 hypothetical protein [Duganella fentianensis]
MNVSFGGQIFRQVQVPLLWGSRAVIGHPGGEFSVIDLSGVVARIEIVKNIPAPNIDYTEREDGVVIFKDLAESFFFSAPRGVFKDISGVLPDCEVYGDHIRVGNSNIRSAMISGFPVGIGVTESGLFLGGPLPQNLAALTV